jgi:hypothetical protein
MLQRAGEVPKQPRQIAARVALQQDRRDERVVGGQSGAPGEPREDDLRALAERKLGGAAPQLGARGARQAAGVRRLRDGAAHGVPAAQCVGQRPRDGGSAAVERRVPAPAPRAQRRRGDRRPARRQGEADPRPRDEPPGGHQDERTQPGEAPALHARRLAAVPPGAEHPRERAAHERRHARTLGEHQHVPRRDHSARCRDSRQ